MQNEHRPKARIPERRGLAAHVTATIILLVLATGAQPGAAQETQPEPEPEVQSLMDQGRALMTEEKWLQASRRFQELSRQEPENPQAWFLLGYCLHAAGDLDQAMPYHLMAAEFESTAPTAMYNIACVYARRNHPDRAFQWLERAWDAGFRNANAYKHDPDLNNIREDARFARYNIIRTPPGAPPPQPLITRPAPTTKRPPVKHTIDLATLPPERRFDFWIGMWDVTWAGGQGTNVVQRVLDGKVIRETFQGRMPDGSELKGISLSTYSSKTAQWTQIWVDNNGTYLDFTGGLEDGRMVLRRKATRDGKTVLQRMVFHDPTANGFHWTWERSDAEGGPWTVQWEIRYERQQDERGDVEAGD